MAEVELTPFVYWGQNSEKIFLKIEIQDVENEDVKLSRDRLAFKAEGSGVRGQNVYSLNFNFYLPVDDNESIYRVMERGVEFQIFKEEKGEVWPRLTADKTKYPWLKIDFDKVAYSDESESEKENDVEENTLDEVTRQLLEGREEEVMPDIKTAYLFVYNLMQFIGFAYIFSSLSISFFRGTDNAMTTTFETAGNQMIFVQLAAFLEILHPILGWVKTSAIAPLMQVLGRNFILFVVLLNEPRMLEQPIVYVLFLVWSSIELIRYPFYILSLIGKKNSFITWLRYTAWIPLYPIGMITEAIIVFIAISYYEDSGKLSLELPNTYNVAFYFPYFLRFYICIFIPAGAFMLKTMHRQRQKALGSSLSKKKN